MKTERMSKVILSATVTTLLSLGAISANAKPIEDGSAFSGSFQAQELACQKRVLNYSTGQEELVASFAIQGTVAGLKVDGSLIPVASETVFDHGGGIVTGGMAAYASENEFVHSAFQINPALNQGKRTLTVDQYVVSEGQIVKTTTVSVDGQGVIATKVCHLIKE